MSIDLLFVFLILMLSCCCIKASQDKDFFLYNNCSTNDTKCPLYFLGFFPCLPDNDERCDELTLRAVELAIETINQDTNILKCFRIELLPVHIQDPQLDPTEVFRILTEKYTDNLPIHGIIGPFYSETARLVSYVFGHASMLQISYSVTDPKLRDTKRYPYFHATVPTINFLNKVRIKLLEHFKWQRVGILCSDDTHHVLVVEDLIKQLQDYVKNKTDIRDLGSFISSPNELLSSAIDNDIRIFIALIEDVQVRTLLCQAYRTGLTTADHVWILPGIYDPNWWYLEDDQLNSTQYNCTNDQMLKVINSTLFVDSLQLNVRQLEERTDFLHEFFSKLFNKTNVFQNYTHTELYRFLHSKALNAYDATTVLALTWNVTLSNFTTDELLILLNQSWKTTTDNKQVLVESLQYNLENVISPYTGLAENYEFNSSEDMFGAALITQFISGRECVLGTFESTSNGNISSLMSCDMEICCNVTWKGNYRPYDRNCKEDGKCTCHIFGTQAKVTIILFGVLFGLGIVTSIGLQILNFYFRNRKNFKSSSPSLNAIITFGTTLMYITGLLGLVNFYLGISGDKAINLTLICNSTMVLMWISIGIIEATIIVKNWRIFRIFYNPFEKDKKCLSDSSLYVGIVILLLPVIIHLVIILPTWRLPEYHNLFPTNDLCSNHSDNPHHQQYIKEIHCIEAVGLEGDFISMLYLLFFPGIIFVLGCHNSRIPSQYFKQEGKMAVLTAAVTGFVGIIGFIVLDINSDFWDFSLRTADYMPFMCFLAWIFPSFVLTTLYLPKFIGIIKENKESKTKRKKQRSTLRRKLSQLNKEAIELKETLSKMSTNDSVISLAQTTQLF